MKKTYSIILLIFVLLPFAMSAQWNRINNSPSQSKLIYFFNPQIGYVLKNNEIYKTTDGGNTWKSITTAFDSFTWLSDIHFVTRDTGFVLSSNNMTFSYPVSASVTYDGGITWNSLLGPFDGGVLDFHFQNSTNWYFHLTSNWSATVDTIYHTTDAGAIWTNTGNASEVQYNQLINNLIVYKDSATASHKLLYKSTDGGATWNLLFTDTTAFTAIIDYQFLNDSDGYVLLYQYNSSDNIDSKIHKTTDGGLIWNNYTLPAACKDPQYMHFTSIDTGYIISNNTNQSRSEIYKTIDAGQTWNIDFSGNINEYFSNGITEYYQKIYVLGNDIITNRITTFVKEMNSIEIFSAFFPNPFSKETILQTYRILNNATLTVYNSNGKTVKVTRNISGQSVNFFRENLPSGLYFICLTEDNKIIKSDKLVITN